MSTSSNTLGRHATQHQQTPAQHKAQHYPQQTLSQHIAQQQHAAQRHTQSPKHVPQPQFHHSNDQSVSHSLTHTEDQYHGKNGHTKLQESQARVQAMTKTLELLKMVPIIQRKYSKQLQELRRVAAAAGLELHSLAEGKLNDQSKSRAIDRISHLGIKFNDASSFIHELIQQKQQRAATL